MIKFTIPLKVNSQYGLNKIYSGQHWRKRQETADEIHTLQKLFKEPVAIHLSYNSKLDLDNHGYLAKMIIDALKGYLIENDDRKYVKALIQDFHSGKDVLVEIWEVGNE